HLVGADQMPERESRILAARKRYDAIVVVFTAMFLDKLAQLSAAVFPVHLFIAKGLAVADIAHPVCAELDSLVGFRQKTLAALLEIFHLVSLWAHPKAR